MIEEWVMPNTAIDNPRDKLAYVVMSIAWDRVTQSPLHICLHSRLSLPPHGKSGMGP